LFAHKKLTTTLFLIYTSTNTCLFVRVPEWTQDLGKPAKSCRSEVHSEVLTLFRILVRPHMLSIFTNQ